MILATCQHHNLKPYTFQSEFRIVYCCLVVTVINRHNDNMHHQCYDHHLDHHDQLIIMIVIRMV